MLFFTANANVALPDGSIHGRWRPILFLLAKYMPRGHPNTAYRRLGFRKKSDKCWFKASNEGPKSLLLLDKNQRWDKHIGQAPIIDDLDQFSPNAYRNR